MQKNNSCCNQNDYWYHANKIGLLFILIFAVFFFWPYFHPQGMLLQSQLMDLSFFAYSGLNWSSFVAGIIQAYFWGYIVIIMWKIVSIDSNCNCQTETPTIAKTKKKK
jgi:hypothetical protein